MINLETILSGINQGLLWALLALGVFLTYRLLDFPDLTVEGSFALGGAVAAIMVSKGQNPFLAAVVSTLAGAGAGLVTGMLHTKLKIPPILSGILTMIALWSINIRIMGSPNQSTTENTVIVKLQSWLNLERQYSVLILGLTAVVIVVGVLYWYFGTESGSAIRATGANEKMCRAQGIQTDTQKILCLMFSNALVGLGGALVAQEQSFGDVSMGVGAIVIGLASVIIGETLFVRARNFAVKLIGVIVGSIVYRVIITLVINSNFMTPSDVKLITAIIVGLALSLPLLRSAFGKLGNWAYKNNSAYAAFVERRRAVTQARKHKRNALREERRRERESKKRQTLTTEQSEQALERAVRKLEDRNFAIKYRARKRSSRALERTQYSIVRKENKRKALAAQAEKERAALQSAPQDKRAALEKRVAKLDSRTAILQSMIDERRKKAQMLHRSLTSGEEILQINNISKTFNAGTINEKKALADLSLTIYKGDFITVIGGNGAGKSTLLNMISGVYGVDKGDIWLDGDNVTKASEHRRAKYLGRVFQDPMLGTAANMEIRENLALAYRRGKIRGLKWAISRAEKAIYYQQLKRLDLGLENRMTARVGLLSGGQRQALTLLMATLVQPKLLLLDEHTAALDPKTAAKVLDLTQEITSEHNLTTMMITHNMKDAIRYGNRLIMMHEGNIIYDVSGEEKSRLSVEDLLRKFEEVSGSKMANDRMLMN